MSKQEVKYMRQADDFIKVGSRACVVPINHPDEVLVSNHRPALTTEVQSFDPATGIFETLNSRYVPA